MAEFYTAFDIGGKVVKDNEVYTLTDNTYLPNLILSETILHPGQQTRGHKHNGLDEVYFFKAGSGRIQIDEIQQRVGPGSIVLIKGGEFHKVFNGSETDSLVFHCVFQAYDRGVT